MILFYAAEKSRVIEVVEGIMADRSIGVPVIHCPRLALLEQRLRRPHHDVQMVLICVGDAIEMRQLSEMRPLLLDMRLMLVLPDRSKDIVAWAHKLSPRFIAYADNGHEVVGAVLQKMIHASGKPSTALV